MNRAPLTLEAVWAKQRWRYGDDIAQQSTLEALSQPRTTPQYYSLVVAKVLDRRGFHDGRGPRSRVFQECPGGLRPQVFQPSPHSDPAHILEARMALAEVPAWLIALHVERGFQCHHRCVHPMSRWFLGWHGGRPAVRCKDCLNAEAKRTQRRQRLRGMTRVRRRATRP